MSNLIHDQSLARSESHLPVILKAVGLQRYFDEAARQVQVLKGIDLAIAAGEFVAIVGSSGSGKSTLLHLLGGLDRPTQGEVWLLGQRFDCLDEALRGQLRNQYLGFVYQFHHLLPEFSALENVAMPLMLRPKSQYKVVKEKAMHLLEQVGLSHRMTHKPGELSGGERQRVALARALVTDPQLILADEPTGNLDRATAEGIFELLSTLCQQHQMAMLIVTHDERLAARADRMCYMQDGQWISPQH